MARFGQIGKQFFDDSGLPLISGKLYFYETGTLTPKDTFADVNLTIANTNPVILSAAGRQPNVFFDGSAKVILTSSDTVQIEVRDPEGGSITGNFDDWNALLIYDIASVVVSGDKYYQSRAAANQGNDPATSPVWWQEVEFIALWNSTATYALNATVKASNGLFYLSLISSNTGNDPISSPAQWGATVDVTPPENILVSARLYSFDNFGGF